MTCMRSTTMRIAICLALGTTAGAAHAASADQCRQAVGFPVFAGSYDVGAWGRVAESTEAFRSRSVVTKCKVDYQVSDGGKGRPDVVYFPVPVEDSMSKDQCAAFGELAAIDSKIYLIKFQDALDKANALMAKLATLRDADKLAAYGYFDIVGGDAGLEKVVSCLDELVNQ